MATVNVTDQSSNPVAGAFVTVSLPPLIDSIGGYYEVSTTNISGNASFPEPGLVAPTGSVADVIVNYTDPTTGAKSAAQGQWTSDILDNWSPDPLGVQLVLDLSITPPSSPSIFPPGLTGAVEEGLLIAAGIGGLAIGAYILTQPGVLGGISKGVSDLSGGARKGYSRAKTAYSSARNRK